jgi:hypothetical protein
METLRRTPFPYISTSNETAYLSLEDYIQFVLDESNIDVILIINRTISLLITYATADTIRAWLQDITTALLGVAYINRFDTLCVRELPFDDSISINPVTQTWSDSTIINSTANPQKFGNVYSALNIKVPYISPLYGTQVFYAKAITFITSLTVDNIKFSSPIYYIESIELRGGEGVSISDIIYNTISCSLTLNSTSLSAQTVEIVIKACVINIESNDVLKTNPLVLGKFDLTKDVVTPYIQSNSEADSHANEYFLALGDPSSNFEIDTYWNPATELCDRITINSSTEGINVDIAVTKQTWTWDGTLSAVVEGRKLFHREV